MKNDIKLYNVLFPFWMLLLFPQMWLIVLPGNFIIDSIVLLVAMKILSISEKRRFYIRNILKIFAIGIFSDIMGSAFMLFMTMVGFGRMGDELYLTIPALVISAVWIFALNYYISFRECELRNRVILSITYALITAPYTFLVPSPWLYK